MKKLIENDVDKRMKKFLKDDAKRGVKRLLENDVDVSLSAIDNYAEFKFCELLRGIIIRKTCDPKEVQSYFGGIVIDVVMKDVCTLEDVSVFRGKLEDARFYRDEFIKECIVELKREED